MSRYNITVEFKKDNIFELQFSSFPDNFYIDRDRPDYTPLGPNPVELFLSSLGGCIGVYAKRYLQRHDISFKKLEIEVSADISSTPPIRIENIEVVLATDADLKEKREIFLRFVKNCPIHNTLATSTYVDLKLINSKE